MWKFVEGVVKLLDALHGPDGFICLSRFVGVLKGVDPWWVRMTRLG